MADSRSVEEKKKLAERRRRVWELRMDRKLPISQIAEALGVETRTVDRDLFEVRKHSRTLFFAALEDEGATLDFGMQTCSNLDAVERQAWSDIVSAGAGSSERSRFLAIVLTSVQSRIKLLQSLGLLQKVAEEFLIHHGATKTSGLSDAELDDIIGFYEEALARGETPGSRPDAVPGPGAVDRG